MGDPVGRNVLQVVDRMDFGNFDLDRGVFLRTVGIQEFSGQIDNRIAAPVHRHPFFIGNLCDNRCLQVLGMRQFDELLGVFGSNDNRHSLLRLGDRKFGSVKTVVFLRNSIEVDVQSVGQLTDCD